MPSTLTYPGVYVEEIPSGVRTITGVATSITAFVGRALRGPVEKATTVNSFGDFVSLFGGLSIDDGLGFAVRDFFLNGGAKAIVVRLYKTESGKQPTMTFKLGGLDFAASSPGRWGIGLRVKVHREGTTDAVAKQLLGPAATKADLFNVVVSDSARGESETWLNLTVKDSQRRVDKVLKAGSSLLLFTGDLSDPDDLPEIPADPTSDDLSTKEAVLKQKRDALRNKLIEDPDADVTTLRNDVTTAEGKVAEAINTLLGKITDGAWLSPAEFLKDDKKKEGLYALEDADLFNLLCIPPYRAPTDAIDVDPVVVSEAAAYCERRRAMLLVDSPKPWTSAAKAVTGFGANPDEVGTRSRNAAIFFPRLRQPDPFRDFRLENFSAVGTIAGVFARTDTERGVWKAPAGLAATLNGVPQLSVALTDRENGDLNPLGINCLRSFPVGGRVVWGARTLRGADLLADEYKYIPARRTALYIEESLFRGLQWVVFEPNDEPLWAQIRLNVGAFMHNLFRQGAFQGATPRDAYFVKCDKETTTQNDINLGIVNVVVGFAPLKPAEFVVIKLQQMAGQIDV